MTNLFLAAQAVMTAGTMGNPNVINDPVYRQCIAAALRAAADYVQYRTDLLAIANELEQLNDH